MDKTLFITIKSPEGITYEGKANALSSKNEQGVFDVLPLHANFISIIKDHITIHEKDKKQEIDITSAILKVSEDKVDIFLGLEAF